MSDVALCHEVPSALWAPPMALPASSLTSTVWKVPCSTFSRSGEFHATVPSGRRSAWSTVLAADASAIGCRCSVELWRAAAPVARAMTPTPITAMAAAHTPSGHRLTRDPPPRTFGVRASRLLVDADWLSIEDLIEVL